MAPHLLEHGNSEFIKLAIEGPLGGTMLSGHLATPNRAG